MIGPGSYAFTLVDRKKDPAFSMGAKLEKEKNAKLNTPGAGSYNIPSRVSHPSFSLFILISMCLQSIACLSLNADL